MGREVVDDLEIRARVLATLIQPYVSSGRLVPFELEWAQRRLIKELEVVNDDD